MNKIPILNILLDNKTQKEFLECIDCGVVFTPNVDHLVKLQRDQEFYDAYKQADYLLCDSKILQLSSFFLKSPIVEKVSGSDFFSAFCYYHKDNLDVKIFLLGAAENVAETAMKNINKKIGRKIVIDYNSPSFDFEKNEAECEEIICQINNSKTTVLAVGVGAPKQEKWILKYKDKMPKVKIFMAVGATLDFEAGAIKRAPLWMSNYGLEWFYRLSLEPSRLWRRYLIDDMQIFFMITKQILGIYKNPWK